GSKTRVFCMSWLESTHQSLAGIKPQCALLADRCDFRNPPQAWRFPVGMSRRVLLKPFFFQGNEIELIGCSKLAVKPVLIHKVAKTPIAISPLHRFVIPGLRQMAQYGWCNITDVDLMRRVSCGRTKAPELIL